VSALFRPKENSTHSACDVCRMYRDANCSLNHTKCSVSHANCSLNQAMFRCTECGPGCTEDGIHYNNATYDVTLQKMLNSVRYFDHASGARNSSPTGSC
jgi:hypothetical protein